MRRKNLLTLKKKFLLKKEKEDVYKRQEPRQVLFVGDSRNDILAAHSAGCPAVGLTYGYNYNIPIADSNPDWVFDDFAKLLEIL